MIEYTVFVPAVRALGVRLHPLAAHAGGRTLVQASGLWYHHEVVHQEPLELHTFIVDYGDAHFVALLNKVVAALHALGEHTVLVRRLSGRGLVHFFLKAGEEVPL